MTEATFRSGSALLAAALLAGSLSASGCYDDECDPACREGYSCYYGVCLSRGFCPEGTANSTPHCIDCLDRDGDGDCVECADDGWRGLCDEGFSCECTFLAGDGTCNRRECVTAEDEWYPDQG